jgi:hypothetical protein
MLQEFNECLKKIEEQLKASRGQSEYALYVKGIFLIILNCVPF